MNASLDLLANKAAGIAMRSSVAFLNANGLTADVDALLACLKSWTKAMLDEAMSDAKAALDCGMSQIADATFCATMAKAGIEAAKEAGFPKG